MAEKGGEVVFELRGDDSGLEKDLSKAEKKIVDSTKKVEEKTVDGEKETAETQKKVKEEVTEHHQTENEKREKSDEESYGKREKSATDHGSKLKSIAGGTAKAIGAGMLATGTAVVGIGVSAVNSANDLDQAMNQYLASTGKSTEETERYKKVMEDIYTNNYGDSFEDIGQAMSAVTQQMGELSDKDLQTVTEGVYALSDVFETDFNETLRGVDQLMTQFGISADEALDLMATGSQEGLNYTDELGDNIAEYGGKFEQAGYSAEEYFQLLKNGTDGGAYNLDKVNDAINEVTNKLADGSIENSLDKYSDKTQNLFKEWQKGEATQKDVIDSIINDISNCKNEQEALTMASTAFGTMGEDANLDFVKSLTSVGDAFDDTEGKMESLKKVKYNDLGSMFEGLKHTVEVLIIPLGEQLIPLLKDIIESILPSIKEFLPQLIDMISGFVEQLMPFIKDLLPKLMDIVSELMPVFMDVIEAILPTLLDLIATLAPLFADLIEAVLPILKQLMEQLLPPIVKIIEKALPPLIKLIDSLMPILQTVIDLLMPIIDLFIGLLDPILDVIENAIVPLIDAIQPLIDMLADTLIPIIKGIGGIFKNAFGNALDTVKEVIGNITNIFKGIVDFIKCIFKGDWEGAWNAIVDIFKNIISGIANIFKIPINWIIDGINGFIDGINSVKIPDWVPIIGGAGFSIPKIPRLKVGMDYVPSDFYPAYLDEGEAVLTKQENAMYRQLGGLQGMFSMSNNIDTPQPVEIPEIDYKRIGDETAKAVEKLSVYMDSKTVGKVIAKPVNDELGKIVKRRG